MKLTILAAVAVGAALCGCSSEKGESATGTFSPFSDGASQDGPKKAGSGFESVPADVTVLLPRDGIPAIWDPQFIEAEDADMPADAEVIGVAFNGEAHAYSINLLDRHEIVNDVVGGRKIAATW